MKDFYSHWWAFWFWLPYNTGGCTYPLFRHTGSFSDIGPLLRSEWGGCHTREWVLRDVRRFGTSLDLSSPVFSFSVLLFRLCNPPSGAIIVAFISVPDSGSTCRCLRVYEWVRFAGDSAKTVASLAHLWIGNLLWVRAFCELHWRCCCALSPLLACNSRGRLCFRLDVFCAVAGIFYRRGATDLEVSDLRHCWSFFFSFFSFCYCCLLFRMELSASVHAVLP